MCVSLLTGPGCNKAPNTPQPDAADPPQGGASLPPAMRLTPDRTNVVFSYAQGGRFVTAGSIGEIPIPARRQVIVTDLSLSPKQRQADRYVYLADLRKARPDGTFPVALASRSELEAGLTGTSTAAAPSDSSRGVVLYTTSWCGVCKKAKRVLNSLGVRFVEKDIEGSKKAAEELASKCAAAGIRPGGVPVIDVAGTLLQGLDETTLETTLRQRGLL